MNRATWVLVLLVLALLAALIALKLRADTQRQQSRDAFQSSILGEFDPSQVQEIELELPSGPVTLRREQGVWTLPMHGSYPANATYVNVLLDALASTPRGSVVSADVSKHKRFGLGGEARVIILRGDQGNELTRLYVGKPADSYRATYIRLRDDARVRYATTDLIPLTSRVTWADRTVWRVPPSSATRFFIRSHGRECTLTRGQTAWLSTDGPVADPPLTLIAGDVELDGCTPPQAPSYEVEIEAESVTMRMLIWQRDQRWLAMRDNNPVCFVLRPDSIAQLEAFLESKETENAP